MDEPPMETTWRTIVWRQFGAAIDMLENALVACPASLWKERLWGDRLVARFDSKLDRTTNTFVVLGLWLEDEALGLDEAFAEALAGGLARFVRFLSASKLDATGIRAPLLRRRACSSKEIC